MGDSLASSIEAVESGLPIPLTMYADMYELLSNPAAPEIAFQRVVMPLMSATLEADHSSPHALLENTDYVVSTALLNPSCPPEVLSAACKHPNSLYRRFAYHHPACPETDSVQAFLSLSTRESSKDA